jgi:hypothetical protein
MYNPYVLNIVDLQNTQSNATGVSLTDTVNALSQMVDTVNKQINANTISAFTPGGTITFTSPTAASGGTTTLQNTDTSGHDLFVYGTVYASNYNSLCPLVFKVHDPTGAEVEVMRITAEGNVGIGTFAPAEKLAVAGGLSVEGNARIRGDLIVDGDIIVRGKKIN